MIKHIRYLRRQAASDYLRDVHGVIRTAKTLAKLAVIGGGPKFRKDSRFPIYAPLDLDDWALEGLSPLVSSTAELAAAVEQEAAA